MPTIPTVTLPEPSPTALVALRNMVGRQMAFYLYLFDWFVRTDSKQDWKYGATTTGGTADLDPATRTAATIRRWQAGDRTLRTPEYGGVAVTDPTYADAISIPDPAPCDQRGQDFDSATVAVDAETVDARISAKALLQCVDADKGRIYATDWPNLTGWTNGTTGGGFGGAVNALDPRLQIVHSASVAGTEKSRWTSYDTAQAMVGKILTIPIQKNGAPSADSDKGALVFSKAQNTANDPLYDGGAGFNGLEIGVKTQTGSPTNVWYATAWLNGVSTALTLSANPDDGDAVVVVELTGPSGGSHYLRVRVDGTEIFNGTIGVELSGGAWYVNMVNRSKTTDSRDVIFGTSDPRGLRIFSETVLHFAGLDPNMLAAICAQDGTVWHTETADGSGNADIDIDASLGGTNYIETGNVPVPCSLRLKDTDGVVIQRTQPFGLCNDTDASEQPTGVYGGDTVRFAKVLGAAQYQSIWQGSEWWSAIYDSLMPSGWDRAAEWGRLLFDDAFLRLIHSLGLVNAPISNTLLLYESFESAASVRGTGGAVVGSRFDTGKHGRAVYSGPADYVSYPASVIDMTEGWFAAWVSVAQDGTLHDWTPTGAPQVLFAQGDEGFIEMYLSPSADQIVFRCDANETTTTLTHDVTADEKAAGWIHVAGYWSGATFELIVNGTSRHVGTPNIPSAVDYVHIANGADLAAGAEIAVDKAVLMSGPVGMTYPNLYGLWALSYSIAVSETPDDLLQTSVPTWTVLDPILPLFDVLNPQRARYARLKVTFNDENEYYPLDADPFASQLTTPTGAYVDAVEPHARFRLGAHAIISRGTSRRQLEEKGTIGVFTSGGYNYSCVLNNEDGWANLNRHDGVFNNNQILNATLAVVAGPVLDDETEEVYRQGLFFVDDWKASAPNRTFTLNAHDRWRSIADKSLQDGISYLAAAMTASGTEDVQLEDNPQTLGFTAAPGYAQVDDEIIAYATWDAGAQLFKDVTRGQLGTVAEVHEQFAPIRALLAQQTVDTVIDAISTEIGLADDELDLPGSGEGTNYIRTTRRVIERADGSVVDAPLQPTVQTGDGYGQIGRPVANPTGDGGAFTSCEINDALVPTTLTTFHGVTFLEAGSGGPTRIWVKILTADGGVAALSPIAAAFGGGSIWTRSIRPSQVGLHTRSIVVSGSIPVLRIFVYGTYEKNVGEDWFYVGIAEVDWQGIIGPNPVEIVARPWDNLGVAGSATGMAGSGSMFWNEVNDTLYYVTHEDGQTRIYSVGLPDWDALVAPVLTLEATLSGYEYATGLTYIPADKNPLGNNTARYILAAQRVSDERPILVMLDTSFADVGASVDSQFPVLGLGFVQSHAYLWGLSEPASFLLGGSGPGAATENVVHTFDPQTMGNLPVGICAIFDMYLQHPRLSGMISDVKLNGTSWSASNYLFDDQGNFPRLSFETLLHATDQLTASYNFLYAVTNAVLGGKTASEALESAAMAACFGVWIDEDDVFHAEPKGRIRPSNMLLTTGGSGFGVGAAGSGLPNLKTIEFGAGLGTLKNTIRFEMGNPYDPGGDAVIVYRDVSAQQPSTNEYVNTLDLFDVRELQLSNLWMFARQDVLDLCDIYLAYYDLKATGSFEALLLANLRLADTVCIRSHFDQIGPGERSRPIGSWFQIIGITRNWQAYTVSGEVREL